MSDWDDGPVAVQDDGWYDSVSVSNPNGSDGPKESSGGCRNCHQDGHFARECTEPRKMTDECYNCGKVGHNKADCPNPKVDRPFTGNCHECGAQGHRVADCPTRPPVTCKHCGEQGHKAAQCSAARDIGLGAIEKITAEEATEALTKAATYAKENKEIDNFINNVKSYVKATDGAATYQDIENVCRNNDLPVYLVALDRSLPPTMTLVNLQGKQDQKYQMSYRFGAKPSRKFDAEGWPSSPEENVTRLAEAGMPMPILDTICRRCGEKGHTSKRCSQDPTESTLPKIICQNCQNEGHRMRHCPEPLVDRRGGVCHNCGGNGHKAADCAEPRNMNSVECHKCGQVGHMARECSREAAANGMDNNSEVDNKADEW